MTRDITYMMDFNKKVIKGISALTAERGYVTGEFPFIPELFIQNSTFIPQATEEINKTGKMGDKLFRNLYVSFFGGITGTFFWYYSRDTLNSKGLYEMCRELRPINDIDELAYGLMGMSVSEGEYEFKELFYEIYDYIAHELEEAEKEHEPEVIDKLKKRLEKTLFHIGMWLALSKLGELEDDN